MTDASDDVSERDDTANGAASGPEVVVIDPAMSAPVATAQATPHVGPGSPRAPSSPAPTTVEPTVATSGPAPSQPAPAHVAPASVPAVKPVGTNSTATVASPEVASKAGSHGDAWDVVGDDGSVAARFAEDFARLEENVSLALKGKRDVVRRALICLFAEGHLLLEDVPGVGKTSLARSIAASIDASCQRIQFTPDLLPSDVTGVSIYNQANQQFEFHPGPVFANIVIGDEINRASPKTQSALLEVMEEWQVTVEGHPRPVNRPFLVIATQNPVEMDGTYRLPEAQLDRFLMRIGLGYPDADAEVEILRNTRRWSTVDALQPVLSGAAVQRMAEIAGGIHVSEGILRYIRAIVDETRNGHSVRLGVSPRGSLALVRSARVLAASSGRSYVTPEDIKELVVPVLAHRMLLASEAEIHGQSAASILEDILERLPVPVRRTG